MIKGIVIAAIKSGSGKSVAAMAIMHLLTKKGIKVAPFKTGPDFIDPSHYSSICGVPGRNLDSYMMKEDFIFWNLINATKGRDCAVIEGVMGLFDGYGEEGYGSTAELAKKLNLPVLLVVDAKGMSQSVLPLIHGFISWDKKLSIYGVILNRVSNETHYKSLKNKIEQLGVKCLGFIPPLPELTIRERHLGLEMGYERKKSFNEGLEKAIKYLDFDRLITLIERSGVNLNVPKIEVEKVYPLDIFISKDEAFSFIYQEHIELLNLFGCKINFFSPLRNESFERADLVYLSGGYPELYAERLSKNENTINSIRKYVDKGGFVLAECGGLIYLSDRIEIENKTFSFAGVLPFKIQMESSFKSLGYVDVKIKDGNPIFEKGTSFRGHRFHYSSIYDEGMLKKTYLLTRKGQVFDEGYTVKNVLASYVHIHFGSNVDGLKKMLKILYEHKQRTLGLKELNLTMKENS